MATEIYDAAIVGAGPAGASLAIRLARAGQRVVLVDRETFPRDKPCAEYLSPAAEPLLRDLGVLEAVMATQPALLRGFRLYAPNGQSFQGDFAASRDAAGHAYFESGLAIPRARLDVLLVQAARAVGADVREGWRVGEIAHEDAGVRRIVPTSGDTDIRARLVIGADGRHSLVARRLGLRVAGKLRKIALVAHARGIDGLTEYGEIHVAGRRYVGLAPLESPGPDALCNVAMVVDEARDGRALAGHPQDFLLQALESFPRIHGRCSRITIVRRTLTTSGLHVGARHFSADGVLLVGDATGYYDPFTGEGIYHALRTAELAAPVALDALARDDLSAANLAHYDHACHRAFRGKRLIEMLIQQAVGMPLLANHIVGVMRRHQQMGHTIIAVTGDFLPVSAVLNPGYVARMIY